jgi:acyl carrier protein
MDVSERQQAILEKVAAMIQEVVEDDLFVDEIAMGTAFSDDLELESIEFVALAEKLREEFGNQVDFAGWLSGMELDQILTLKVGDLVRFIEEKD